MNKLNNRYNFLTQPNLTDLTGNLHEPQEWLLNLGLLLQPSWKAGASMLCKSVSPKFNLCLPPNQAYLLGITSPQISPASHNYCEVPS